MTTIDEAELIRRQIERLRVRAAAFNVSPGQRRDEIAAWIRDVCETIQAHAGAGDYLNKESAKLRVARDKTASITRANDLLDGLEWKVTIDNRDSISDDFRRAVNIAVKDEYFKSWPFHVIATVATALAVLLVGGTLYAGIKVEGVLKDVADIKVKLSESAAHSEAKFREFNNLVEDKKAKLDEIVRTALISNNSEIAEIFKRAQSESTAYVNETKAKLNSKQTEVLQALDRELRDQLQAALSVRSAGLIQDAERISGEWKSASGKLIDQLAAAKAALDASKNASMTEVETTKGGILKTLDETKRAALEGLKSPAAALDDEKKKALAALDNERTAAIAAVKLGGTKARDEIATFEAEVGGKRNEALRSIRAASENFSKEIEEGRKRIAEDIARLPNDVKALSATMMSIDSALGRYQISLAAVIRDIGSDQHTTKLKMVADFLGIGFWLVIGSFAAALTMMVALGIVLWRQRRPTQASVGVQA